MKTRRTAGGTGLLERLGLHRPELRAWALYDLATAAVLDVVVTAVFPIYYASVAAAGVAPALATRRFAVATTVALCAQAVLAPVLGPLADAARARKRLLSAFLALGVAAVALLSTVGRGDWLLAAVLFVLANVGTDGSLLFHGALLPHVARPGELDRTSTTACALGYLGAGLVLAAVLVALERPAWFGLPAGPGLTLEEEALPARLAFPVVAAWWILFSIPLLRARLEAPGAGAPRKAGVPLLDTWRRLRRYPETVRFAAAALLYSNGIGTIVRMAVIFGAEVGIGQAVLLAAIVLVDLVGTPFAFAFGALAARIGTKRAIQIGLGVYVACACLGYFMRTTWHFFALALLVASVQGGTQALSRSLFASLVPTERSAEFFGFFAVAGKVAAVTGPALFAVVLAASGSSRNAIASIVVFFAMGAAMLATVDVERGQRAASAESRSPL